MFDILKYIMYRIEYIVWDLLKYINQIIYQNIFWDPASDFLRYALTTFLVMRFRIFRAVT